ncbi:MAG TPA: monofunctional biosynthetic peptidoglycan transglycosylase [Azospirillaceae bacterium]|nr:monofunctional biosynthetic peptidoglycan transglycosylase [Azospirillaceae bacterium]
MIGTPGRLNGRALLRWAVRGLLGLLAVSVLWTLLYRVVDPPGTLLMAVRALQGARDADYRPVGIEEISPHLARAVMAGEDTRFCLHGGVDWEAVEDAQEANRRGRPLRGASTISMQTAKNAFLWPGRTWLRKGAELYYTLLAEALWPKRRIMETYLNIAEWGDGLYGAEAAARAHFGVPAAKLTPHQAALMAAVLPNPRRWNPARPTAYIQARAGVIRQRMAIVERDRLDSCLRE